MSRPASPSPSAPAGHWTFLSNHSHVLVCLARDPNQTVREIASQVQITERAVLKILSELESAAVLTRQREGRRTRYQLNLQAPLRHPLEAHASVADLLGGVLAPLRWAARHGLQSSSAGD